MDHNNKNIQSHAIKTLYEVGYRNPALIAGHIQVFLSLLQNSNNRMVWGAMIAIAEIVKLLPHVVFEHVPLILESMKTGSVITNDAGIQILAYLNAIQKFRNLIEPDLLEALWKCPIKQLPQYIEKCFVCIDKSNKDAFMPIIEKRYDEAEKATRQKRLMKALKKISKI